MTAVPAGATSAVDEIAHRKSPTAQYRHLPTHALQAARNRCQLGTDAPHHQRLRTAGARLLQLTAHCGVTNFKAQRRTKIEPGQSGLFGKRGQSRLTIRRTVSEDRNLDDTFSFEISSQQSGFEIDGRLDPENIIFRRCRWRKFARQHRAG